MVDILYLAHGRSEFTRASLEMLQRNTDWTKARLVIYTDGDDPGPLLNQLPKVRIRMVDSGRHGGPVAIMNHFLAKTRGSDVFAKLDNDVIVPAEWLDRGLEVMGRNRDLMLLGIEPPASRTPAPWRGGVREPAPELKGYHPEGYVACHSIGGIGMMRRSAFDARGVMSPHSIYGGFTDWQLMHSELLIGWIWPPLKVFLLDRLPVEPWASFSRGYIEAGQQRAWTNYAPEDAALWNWWMESQKAAV